MYTTFQKCILWELHVVILNKRIETGGVFLKYGLLSFGILLTVIFGGGFFIRLFRDGDFYIDQFIGGVIGITLLIIGIVKKKALNPDY